MLHVDVCVQYTYMIMTVQIKIHFYRNKFCLMFTGTIVEQPNSKRRQRNRFTIYRA